MDRALRRELKETIANLKFELGLHGIDARTWRHWDTDIAYAQDELIEALSIIGFPDIDYDGVANEPVFIRASKMQAAYNMIEGGGYVPQ